MRNKEYKICTNCVMDTTDSKITFDENGVCDHCQTFYKDIQPNWYIDEKGWQEIVKVADDIKKEITVNVVDVNGRRVELQQNLHAGQVVEIGTQFRSGTYFAEVSQGIYNNVVKLVKVN